MQYTITKLPLIILSQHPANCMPLDELRGIMCSQWQIKATSTPPTMSAVNDAIAKMTKVGHIHADASMIYLSDSGKSSINHRSSAGRGVCIPRLPMPAIPWPHYHHRRCMCKVCGQKKATKEAAKEVENESRL